MLITDTYPPDINGVARTLRTLALGLAERGHAIEIVTTVPCAADEPDTPPRRVVTSAPLPGYPGLRVGFSTRAEMASHFAAFQPDALYVATETPLGIASILAAAQAQIPVVSGFHTNFQTYLESYHLPGLETFTAGILRWIHNQTARTLTPSADTATMLQGWGIRNVGVLGRGVDTTLFSPERRSRVLRQSWGAADHVPVAIYVGRIAAEKNLPLLVRAFGAFRQMHPGAPCVVVGEGPRLAGLQEEHPDYIYMGARRGTDLAECYASADVFLFPSSSETFGNVVLEAMSSGLVTAAYDYAAPRLLIRSSSNGWLAPLEDEAAFLQATQQAAASWSEPKLRAAARQAASDFGWHRVIKEFEAELLTAITSAKTATSHPKP
jgi:glycosyltransferase involved in cell wall biosynthesis